MGRSWRTIHIDAKPNRLGKKTMLCVWWDQRGERPLKPGETVNTKRYQQLLTDLDRSLLEKIATIYM